MLSFLPLMEKERDMKLTLQLTFRRERHEDTGDGLSGMEADGEKGKMVAAQCQRWVG